MSYPSTDAQVYIRFTNVGAKGVCWEWEGCRNAQGYGYSHRRGTTVRGHHLAFTLLWGDIPVGMIVRHRCDNPGCCNPHHLELGTHADNARDRVERGRAARGERAGTAKLTDDAVREIRNTPKQYGVMRKLMRRFGVSEATIWAARSGRSWGHVI